MSISPGELHLSTFAGESSEGAPPLGDERGYSTGAALWTGANGPQGRRANTYGPSVVSENAPVSTRAESGMGIPPRPRVECRPPVRDLGV